MKLQQTKNQYLLTIPNALVRAKGWEKHDDIEVKVNDKGDLVLKRKSPSSSTLS